MTATRGEFATLTIADRVLRAGGVMVVRDGHQVAANFGSTATELAVCVKRVGLAVRSDLGTLELAGPERWLAHLLGHALDGRVPEPGDAIRTAGAWCCRVAPDRAIIAGSWSATARWKRVVREAVAHGAPLDLADRSETAGALTLVGPRAERLLDDAGLPAMAMGAVAECWFAGGPVLLLRETAQRFLLVVDAERAVGAWQELFEAGRALGLSMVGTEALDRLAAAPRV
jgi:glycine cleavage system aminomethyltransferase T